MESDVQPHAIADDFDLEAGDSAPEPDATLGAESATSAVTTNEPAPWGPGLYAR